jgi:hypothetical protein
MKHIRCQAILELQERKQRLRKVRVARPAGWSLEVGDLSMHAYHDGASAWQKVKERSSQDPASTYLLLYVPHDLSLLLPASSSQGVAKKTNSLAQSSGIDECDDYASAWGGGLFKSHDDVLRM